MSYISLSDELYAGYNDKLADLMLSRNLDEHYLEVSACIHQINALIETGKLIEEELAAFMQLGYQYYRLKDQFMQAILSREMGEE